VRVLAVSFAAIALTGGALAASASGAAVPNLPWTELLPPLLSPNEPADPIAVAHCKRPSMKCVRVEIKRMKRLRNRLGCDHRAVFATTYLELTKAAKRTLKGDPGFLRQPRFFFREDALFANVYFDTVKAWKRGQPVADAWRIAFEAAQGSEVTAAQDMLLGINAHVQNDMPFVLAALSLRDRDGNSRKPDHDKFNRILNAAYERVVQAINRRYDPTVSLTNASWWPIDDLAGLEAVRGWRELVWRNAERLVNASSRAERTQVANQIEANAALWATLIALPPVPGYRAQRDAYCEAQLPG
jgi:hypothetical protein